MSYYFGKIVKLRNEFFEAFEKENYYQAANLGKDILALYRENKDCKSLEYANDLNNLAIVFDEMGDLDQAIKLYSVVDNLKKELTGEYSVSRADTLNNLGIVLCKNKRYDKAIIVLKLAFTLREQKLGLNHVDTILCQYNLANAYEMQGDITMAIKTNIAAFNRANAKDRFPIEDMADIAYTLAREYGVIGNYKKMLAGYLQTLDLMQKSRGERNLNYFQTLGNLAQTYEKMEEWDSALLYYDKALKIWEKILDKKHLDYVFYLNRMAGVYVEKKDYMQSKVLHQKALKILIDLSGKSNDLVAALYGKLADDFYHLNEIYTALDYKKMEMEVMIQIYGEQSPPAITSISELGFLYAQCGDGDSAFSALEKALRLSKEGDEKAKEGYVNACSGLGEIYKNSHLIAEATEWFASAVFAQNQIPNFNQEKKIKNLLNLAGLYGVSNNWDEYDKNMAATLQACQDAYGQQHPKYAESLVKLAKIHIENAKYSVAYGYLKQAVELQEKLLGEDTKIYAMTMIILGDVLCLLKNFKEAIQTYQKVITVNNASKNWDPVREGICMGKIGIVFSKLGERKKALECFNQAFRLQEDISKEEDFITLARNSVSMYLEAKQWKQAKQILERMIRIQEEETQKAEDLPLHYCQLGIALWQMDQQNEAKEQINHGLHSVNEEFGEESEQAYVVFNMLGDFYQQTQQDKDALAMFQAATKGAKGVNYIENQWKISQVFIGMSKISRAIRCLENARKAVEEEAITAPARYENILYLLVDLYEQKDNYNLAVDRFQKYIDQLSKLDYVDEKKDIQNISRLGDLYSKCGEKDAALNCYEQAAISIKNSFGKTRSYCQAMLKQVELLESLGKEKKAVRLLNLVLDVCVETESTLLESVDILSKCGDHYYTMELFEQAEQCYVLSHDILLAKGGEFSVDRKKRLLTLYNNKKDFKKASLLKSGKRILD